MQTHHLVRIGAPRDLAGGARPAILHRTDDDFIESTLDDLRSAEGRARLQELRARSTDAHGTLKLFQPIQRQFHLALIEAWCDDMPTRPRIDPARVESAGMVLRRLGPGGRREGWMRSNGRVRGWLPLARVGGDDGEPGSTLRLRSGLTGVADIDRQFTRFAAENPDTLLNEDVLPLYPAPPEVCAAAGQSVFYGNVPTVSGELSEALPGLEADDGGFDFGPDSAAFRDHLVTALRGNAMNFPFAGETIRAGWFEVIESPGTAPPPDVPLAQFSALIAQGSERARMARFLLLLRQLSSEFNAFDGGAEVGELKAILAGIRLRMTLRQDEDERQRRHVRADEFLQQAVTILLERGSAGSVEMPEGWPDLDSDTSRRLAAALHRAMQARFLSATGKAGRFDEPDARYVLRAFVRLKPEGPCPARTVWSGYSEPFVIAPWYDGAGAPPVQIRLPDPSDRKLLRSLKPNVAFVVPPAMQNLLSGAAKDLMEGKGGTGTLGITWICSFSIPIITICAFLVLNIFLTLFNIVFGWLFFIKICIPFPKFGNKPPGGDG